MKTRRFRMNATLLGLVAMGLLTLPAHAVMPVVKTVPWVTADPLIPHTTIPGKAVRLKGTADQQGANVQFVWDFGDGSPPLVGTVANRYAIEAQHTYVGPVGRVWTARLTVTDNNTGEAASRPYYVQMKAQALDAEANIAIDEGLWYLHKTMVRNPGACTDCGNWQSGGYASSGYHGVTAANLNAFMVNGHQEAGTADNPYTETVGRGMRFLFTQLGTRAIGNQADPVNGGSFSPDVNPNGRGIYNPQNEAYQTGMLLSALVASGTPGAIAPLGATGVVGQSYLQIAQDIVDNISYCQFDGSPGGGWYYSCNGGVDNSISQWMAIGLLGARSFGAQLPQHVGAPLPDVVPEWNKSWLRYSQVAPNPPSYTNGGGYFGYQSTGSVWGPYATTASGMVQLVLDGIGRGSSPANGPSWEGAETFMRENFDNELIYGHNPTNSIKDYYYGLFSFTKSMLLHDADGNGVAEPIRCLTSWRTGSNKPPIDWYAAETGKVDSCSGVPPSSNGVARTLINDQNPAGYWSGHNYSGDQYPFETAWAVMMLNRTVFESGVPVAVPKSIPNPGVVGQVITLDGSDSFHQDAGRIIDSWQWDLNNDGIWDVSGPLVTASFGAIGSYPVTLRVTDNGAPEKAATGSVTVLITMPPVAPTASAGGPYNFCPQTANWFLDGTGSVNPDQGQSEPGRPGDRIQSYLWDLDGDGLFNDASGAQPNVSGVFQGLPAGTTRLVQLQVTDTTGTSFPSSGMGDLSSTASAVVRVRASTDPLCSCVGNLAARAKAGKVQLTWTDANAAAGYNVYRGSQSGGPYTLLGHTTSSYSTFLDSGLTLGSTYHYVVRRTAANSSELCQSNQASATATPR